MCCMISCFCCIKKRGELYNLRHRAGIDNRNIHLRNSHENIPMSAVERGEYERAEDQRMFQELDDWATRLRNRTVHGVIIPQAQNFVNSQVENDML